MINNKIGWELRVKLFCGRKKTDSPHTSTTFGTGAGHAEEEGPDESIKRGKRREPPFICESSTEKKIQDNIGNQSLLHNGRNQRKIWRESVEMWDSRGPGCSPHDLRLRRQRIAASSQGKVMKRNEILFERKGEGKWFGVVRGEECGGGKSRGRTEMAH